LEAVEEQIDDCPSYAKRFGPGGACGCDRGAVKGQERCGVEDGAASPRDDAVIHVIFLKRVLLLFWAVWLSVVFLSNLADAGKGLGLFSESWAFASGNWRVIQETTARYGTSDSVNGVLFAGVILWEGIAALLFWRAGWTFRSRGSGRQVLYSAFTASLLLWGAFLIADEVCIAYPVESTHLRLFVAHLVTLLAVELLPEV
jgi:hypothetical protein